LAWLGPAKKERIGGLDLTHMMQLAVPEQNGCQKRVVQLDTKASERGGSLSSLSLRAGCHEFLETGAKTPHHCKGDRGQLLIL
jgi:hypothetical protein